MPLTHAELVRAVKLAIASENRMGYPRGTAQARYDWLTEVDLTARIRQALVYRLPVRDQKWMRLNAQGRTGTGAIKHDIEIGSPIHSPIEVVFYKPKGSKSCRPIKYLDEDLTRLFGYKPMHVVAFFPKMRTGYAINKHSHNYSLSHSRLTPRPDTFISGDCLSLAKLSPANMRLCTDIFFQVPRPVSGAKSRYSLNPAWRHAVHKIFILPGVNITRSIVGVPADHLWAAVWSNV